MPKYRSSVTTEGRNMAGARALWRATGVKDGDFGKPIIAVANSFTQFVPGHVHLHDIGQLVVKEIEKAGMEYARLAKNKDGDICLILNRSQGARMSKSTSKNHFNTTINSKDICNKLRTLLNIRSDYSILSTLELPSTSDYIILKLTKQA